MAMARKLHCSLPSGTKLYLEDEKVSVKKGVIDSYVWIYDAKRKQAN